MARTCDIGGPLEKMRRLAKTVLDTPNAPHYTPPPRPAPPPSTADAVTDGTALDGVEDGRSALSAVLLLSEGRGERSKKSSEKGLTADRESARKTLRSGRHGARASSIFQTMDRTIEPDFRSERLSGRRRGRDL
jgi:hypothetical protein